MTTYSKKETIAIILSLIVISLVVLGSMLSNFTILDFSYLVVIVVCAVRYILIKRSK